MSAIELRDVACTRGDVRVLDGLDLAIEAGETFALVGRSGTGKTTLLRLINALLLPDRGAVLVDGQDTRRADPIRLRRRIGYVLQETGLFPHLTVARNVAVVLELEGWDAARRAARVDEVLLLVGLDPRVYADRWPDELSGGQRQRVGVARALAADPPMLLMDEPFGALDPVTRLELHREFRRIQSLVRKTVVLVTHDLREACALADRIGVLDGGRLAACDAPARLLASEVAAVQVLVDTLRDGAVPERRP